MASLPSSPEAASPQTWAPAFRTGDGSLLASPQEWEPATLILDGFPVDFWRDLTARLNGQPLPVRLEHRDGKDVLTAPWPRSAAGAWKLEVGHGVGSTTCLITVRPSKIDDASLAALLRDLEDDLPASIALSLERLGAFAGIDWRPPRMTTLAQEIEQVRRALVGGPSRPGLIDILDRLGNDPHRMLVADRPWVRTETARRPSAIDIPAAIRRPGNLNADQRPLSVVDSRVVHSFDTYENRLVRTFYDSVAYRLRRLRRSLARRSNIDAALTDEFRDLERDLVKARRSASFLDDVGRLKSPPTALTMVMLRRPGYRAALEGLLAFRRSASLHFEHPAFDAPMDNIPFLYETWGTLVLVAALLDVAAAMSFRVVSHRLFLPSDFGFVTFLPKGSPAIELADGKGCTVTLTPQQRFEPVFGGRFRSMSLCQIPDVTVEIRRGNQSRLFLFDPKYKLEGDGAGGDGRPRKEDIDKMHAYRDAIRDRDGERPVRMAAILYPGEPVWHGDEIAALSAMPGDKRIATTATELFRDLLSEDDASILSAAER